MASSRKWRTKDNMCERCGMSVENMTRMKQDEHEIECKRQMKLD